MDSPPGEDVLLGSWRRARTRIGNLLKMGVSKDHAISTGRSSRGPWRLSCTEATQLAMSNK
jgi:RNA-directed DNA polymerase